MKKFLLAFFGGIFTTLLALVAMHSRSRKNESKKQTNLEKAYEQNKKDIDSILPKPLPEDAAQIEATLKEKGFVKK